MTLAVCSGALRRAGAAGEAAQPSSMAPRRPQRISGEPAPRTASGRTHAWGRHIYLPTAAAPTASAVAYIPARGSPNCTSTDSHAASPRGTLPPPPPPPLPLPSARALTHQRWVRARRRGGGGAKRQATCAARSSGAGANQRLRGAPPRERQPQATTHPRHRTRSGIAPPRPASAVTRSAPPATGARRGLGGGSGAGGGGRLMVSGLTVAGLARRYPAPVHAAGCFWRTPFRGSVRLRQPVSGGSRPCAPFRPWDPRRTAIGALRGEGAGVGGGSTAAQHHRAQPKRASINEIVQRRGRTERRQGTADLLRGGERGGGLSEGRGGCAALSQACVHCAVLQGGQLLGRLARGGSDRVWGGLRCCGETHTTSGSVSMRCCSG
ncbi:hypothetical protein JKP88DRAFT_219670 [Tribonema minus]|uniref:Uncharacterized protein n=1 Tax=Tribonema minus TaxID=303371 RepID=A0A835Z2X5_9STRA|nr:hypothetical protein JKP88DRAFT_219670 [Tribonema minus]